MFVQSPIIEQLLFNKSQEELANRLGVKRNTVSSWLISTKQIDPAKISIATMAAIAFEKGWTIKRLFIYLGLKDLENAEDLRFKLKSITTTLSLPEQIDLLAWLSTLVGKTVKNSPLILEEIKRSCDRTLCIILDKEDLALASNYTGNLALHLQLNPDNIQVTTIPKLPQSLADVDILIFDISSPDSPSIPLVEEISFEGDIVVFVPDALPADVMANLSKRVTDVVVKPIDWQELKDKDYFG